MPPRSASHEQTFRARAIAAEAALAEAEALIAELHEQVFRANAAACRMADLLARAGRRLAA